MLPQQFTTVSFYVVAHADDWQLFMQPNAYNDLINPACKVVFIITTAGDAGLGKTYWAAREEGCKSSLLFCLAPLKTLSVSDGIRDFNRRSIYYWSANNVTCYFFRLPDGNLDGNGFSPNHNQSLIKLRNREINTIHAVDNSAAYKSWSDFHEILKTILHSESENIDDKLINYINPDIIANPNDHVDHLITGKAIQEINDLHHFRQALFVGYNVSNDMEYLHQTDLFWKAGMFAAYEKAVFDKSGYSTLRENIPTYVNWCLSKSKFINIASQLL